jgi:hypothetical protein
MKQLPDFEETNRLACGHSRYEPGVFKTPNGYVVRSRSAQVFISLNEVDTEMAAAFMDMGQEIGLINTRKMIDSWHK